MKKFVLHYSSSPEAMAAMAQATPEEKAAAMKPWLEWRAAMGEKIVDFGAPIMAATSIHADGSSAQNSSEVTGYSIIQAEDLEEVKAMLKAHPHLQYEGSRPIQVFECIQM